MEGKGIPYADIQDGQAQKKPSKDINVKNGKTKERRVMKTQRPSTKSYREREKSRRRKNIEQGSENGGFFG